MTLDEAKVRLDALDRAFPEKRAVLYSRAEGGERSFTVEYPLDDLSADDLTKLVEAAGPQPGEGKRIGHVESRRRRPATPDARPTAWLVRRGAERDSEDALLVTAPYDIQRIMQALRAKAERGDVPAARELREWLKTLGSRAQAGQRARAADARAASHPACWLTETPA